MNGNSLFSIYLPQISSSFNLVLSERLKFVDNKDPKFSAWLLYCIFWFIKFILTGDELLGVSSGTILTVSALLFIIWANEEPS